MRRLIERCSRSSASGVVEASFMADADERERGVRKCGDGDGKTSEQSCVGETTKNECWKDGGK